jgi:hypothetical protein
VSSYRGKWEVQALKRMRSLQFIAPNGLVGQLKSGLLACLKLFSIRKAVMMYALTQKKDRADVQIKY